MNKELGDEMAEHYDDSIDAGDINDSWADNEISNTETLVDEILDEGWKAVQAQGLESYFGSKDVFIRQVLEKYHGVFVED